MQDPRITSGEGFFAVELPVPTEEQVRAYQKLTHNGELSWAEALSKLPPEDAMALTHPQSDAPAASPTNIAPACTPAAEQAETTPAPIAEPEPRCWRVFGRAFTVTRAATNAGFPRLDGNLFIAPLVEVTKVLDATSTRWDIIWGSRNFQTQVRPQALAVPHVDDPTPELSKIVAGTSDHPAPGAGDEPGFKGIGKFFYRRLLFRRAPKGQRPGSMIEGGVALHYFEIARVFHVDLPPSYGVLAWRLIVGRFTLLIT